MFWRRATGHGAFTGLLAGTGAAALTHGLTVAEGKGGWLGNANLRAHVRLVDATLGALPEIVTGRRPATDIIFPSAAVDLVEGIFKHHHAADYFNAVAADVVADFVEARLKHDPGAEVRIIELGAGTGGTSEAIFKRLQPHAETLGRALAAHAAAASCGKRPISSRARRI